jgi:hypothetical protein
VGTGDQEIKLNVKSGLPIDTERVHLAYLKRLILSLEIGAPKELKKKGIEQ